jgi:UDP-N-acetylglucosamine 1-carboxyvinyltransferase
LDSEVIDEVNRQDGREFKFPLAISAPWRFNSTAMDRFYIWGGQPLEGRVTCCGAKNATLPLMAAALLCDGPTTLTNVPDLRDVATMAQVLASVGAVVTIDGPRVTIDPSGFNSTEAPYDIVRKMRASIYVMGPMLARLGRAKVSLPGGCAIGPRPVDLHLRGFENLGVDVKLEHGNIVASTYKLKGADFSLAGPAGSSVGATANVLMAAVLAEGQTVIRGAAMEPEIDDLVRFLSAAGAKIEGGGTSTLVIDGVGSLRGVEHGVIPDRIEAGTFLVAGAMTGGDVTVDNVAPELMETVIDELEQAGAKIEEANRSLHVTRPGPLRPLSIRTLPYPGFPTDMQAQFMAMCCLAEGDSTLTETIYPERFIHVGELQRMGANVHVFSATATVRGVEKMSGAPVMASDLRASAALVLAGLVAEGVTEILRVYHIDRGYEHIEDKLASLGARIRRAGPGEVEVDW